jgi:hypothetical protein
MQATFKVRDNQVLVSFNSPLWIQATFDFTDQTTFAIAMMQAAQFVANHAKFKQA